MQEQEGWKFAYEALAHLGSLRLFVFNSRVPYPFRCQGLSAHVLPAKSFSSSSLVACQWTNAEDGQAWAIYVPVPFCPIDHSVPFAVFAAIDHIEVKIKLLCIRGKTLDYFAFLDSYHREEAVENNGWSNKELQKSRLSSFSLTSDVDVLSGKQGFYFYCRSCSAKLTSEPISRVQALPSTEWRELADHWFGACCYSNGTHTKSLLARFGELLTPTTGVCLVASTTCMVHCNDLARNDGDQGKQMTVGDQVHSATQTGSAVEILQDGDNKADGEKFPFRSGMQLWTEESKELNNSTVGSSGPCHVAFEESLGLANCGSGHGHEHNCGYGSRIPEEIVGEMSTRPQIEANSLTSGFMSCSAFSSTTEVTEFNCHACSTLIGISTGERDDVVQLFKCRISSDPSRGPSDVYRFHTLERVFSNELLSSLEEGSSYRYIVRDLKSKSPLLQLVLINHESWSCSGSCWRERADVLHLESRAPLTKSILSKPNMLGIDDKATDREVVFPEERLAINRGGDACPPVSLEPVMKVMFRDTSSFKCEELRDVEEWAQKQEADDIFMLESEVVSLAKSLQVNKMLFPDSCAKFQQFQISFLAR